MLSSPQRAMVPIYTGQLATSPVFKQKRTVIETALPVQLSQFLKQCYGLEEGADLYILPNNPNKLFVLCRGQLRTVDLSAWQATQQSSIPPEVSNDDLKVSPKSPLENAERDGRVAPPATPVTPLRTPSTVAHLVYEPEWHKAISDKEREFLQKERRRMSAYKTSLCNAFRDTGQCAYGFHCRFAHGIDELRAAPGPHPKYKTRLCNKFTLYGLCPYGSHCQFIHWPPCEQHDDSVGYGLLVHMNFTASLDSGSKHALHCRHSSAKPRFCARNACVVKVAGCDHCDSFSQHYFGSGNNLQTIEMTCNHCDSEAAQNFWYHHLPHASHVTSNNAERTLDIMPMVGSNELNPDITAVNDLFSTMSIGQHNNPFTQSCFPRINLENRAEKSANVSNADMTYRAP
uniref:C3H1-type domain-containing protein n=1 Tax=Wuchereria bancrofti TaxID=6293 RepID=A0A1I8EKZ6_WUCBA